jgi:hypothetical protein
MNDTLFQFDYDDDDTIFSDEEYGWFVDLDIDENKIESSEYHKNISKLPINKTDKNNIFNKTWNLLKDCLETC